MSLLIARQPIFDSNMVLIAYELLFRDSKSSVNAFPVDMDSDTATSKLISGLQFNHGLSAFTGGKPGFINFTDASIINGQPLLFDASQMVVEILETATPSPVLLEAIKDLYHKGYSIALDDYIDDPAWHDFYPFIKLIKIDLLNTTTAQIERLFELRATEFPKLKLLAEKVEDYDEFARVKAMGFDLYQGYFFSHPQVIRSRTLSIAQTTITSLVTSLLDDDVDVSEIGRMIEREPSLSYKLLRYAQSPMFKRQSDVSSIKQAIVNLGVQELKRFCSLLFASEMAQGKHKELNKQALCRAKFCELLDNKIGTSSLKNDAFLTGLLSLMDAMLDAKIESLLQQISVNSSVRSGICEGKGLLGSYLKIAKQFETPAHRHRRFALNGVPLSSEQLTGLYMQAMTWAEQSAELG